MTYEQTARTYLGEVNASRIMGVNYLREEDLDICKYVVNHIPNNIDIGNIYLGNKVSLDEFINKSLDEISVFGIEFVKRIKELLSNVTINRNDNDLFGFCTYILYSFEDNNICLDSGRVDSYHIPSELFEFSLFDFSHEHIHSLKDINYYEYVNSFVLGETIPLFYELISFDPNNILKREYIKSRLYNLNNDKNVFMVSDEFYNMVDTDDKCLHEHIRSKMGCYLNSFYYAVILYNMYKDSSKKILDLVSKVLRHEITTLEMLKMLDVYGNIRGEVFEKELSQMKRVLKI